MADNWPFYLFILEKNLKAILLIKILFKYLLKYIIDILLLIINTI